MATLLMSIGFVHINEIPGGYGLTCSQCTHGDAVRLLSDATRLAEVHDLTHIRNDEGPREDGCPHCDGAYYANVADRLGALDRCNARRQGAWQH